MEAFINKILDKLNFNDISNSDIENVLIILPNRRAHRTFLDELANRFAGKTFFAPTIFPMDEFVSFLSPLKTIDKNTQILRLHEVTRTIHSERCTLANLQTWCLPFLRDISDMDMQLQDVENILKLNADSAKFEISLGKDQLSTKEQEKIMFNELLANIYFEFRNLLVKNSEAYAGMQYRDCAENIALYAQNINYKQIIFAGFYALSPSELNIIKYINEHFKTQIFFDIDPFYCHIKENNQHEIRKQTSFFLKRDCEFLGLEFDKIDFWSFNNEIFRRKIKKNVKGRSNNLCSDSGG